MTNREPLIQSFLANHHWGNAQRSPLKGDASFRRYERLSDGNRHAILMDAPPPHENVAPFVRIANYLKEHGLSAPAIYAADIENGFLLVEDLGDNDYIPLLRGIHPLSSQVNEEQLYTAAADVLLQLHQAAPLTGLAKYDEATMLREVELFLEWYMPHMAKISLIEKERMEFSEIWKRILPLSTSLPETLILRDYHSPNLMWLPEREGVKKVGILDFQDAVIGSPAYDLVSLLQDPRRDVSLEVVDASIIHYMVTRKELNTADFLATYAILGAQRSMRILGVFSRLAVRDKKPHYLDFMPRVWTHLYTNFDHPALAEMKAWLDRVLPRQFRVGTTAYIQQQALRQALQGA